jgi:hypothetical protein
MQISFAIEVLVDFCAKIQTHPVLAQYEDQLLELFLM